MVTPQQILNNVSLLAEYQIHSEKKKSDSVRKISVKVMRIYNIIHITSIAGPANRDIFSQERVVCSVNKTVRDLIIIKFC